MASICGTDCCENCAQRKTCGACEQTNGHPFGGSCTAAEAVRRAGPEELLRQKQALIAEFNALALPGLQVNDLNLLNGSYVNLAYPLPGGQAAQFLQDNRVYWGNQIEVPGNERCYGVVADETFLLVCRYGCAGGPRQRVLYKKISGGTVQYLGGGGRCWPPRSVFVSSQVSFSSPFRRGHALSLLFRGAAEHAFCASACEKEETPVFSFSRGVSEKFPALSMYQIRPSRPVWLL